jgi:hypothetical protein
VWKYVRVWSDLADANHVEHHVRINESADEALLEISGVNRAWISHYPLEAMCAQIYVPLLALAQ